MTESPDPFAFSPVPVRARRDGWTPERQRGFIAAMRETLSAARAAAAVGMTREGAYALRRRSGAQGFAAAWDAALAGRPPRAPEPSRYARAIEGVSAAYFYGGLQRAAYLRFDDRALLAILSRSRRTLASSQHRNASTEAAGDSQST